MAKVKRYRTRLDRAFYKLERDELWHKQHGRCYHCKEPVPKSEATMDHLIPISVVGQHHKDNGVMSCFDCNQDKADKLDWEPERESVHPMLDAFYERLEDRVRRFAWRMDMNPKGSYNKWLRYQQKRGQWL